MSPIANPAAPTVDKELFKKSVNPSRHEMVVLSVIEQLGWTNWSVTLE